MKRYYSIFQEQPLPTAVVWFVLNTSTETSNRQYVSIYPDLSSVAGPSGQTSSFSRDSDSMDI